MITHKCFRTFALLLLILASAQSIQNIPYQVTTFKPFDAYPYIFFNAGELITYTVSSPLNEQIQIRVAGQSRTGFGTVSLQLTAADSTRYIFYFYANFRIYSQKTITIKRDRVVILSSVINSPFSFVSYYKFTVSQSNCQISTINYSGPVLGDQIQITIYILRFQDYVNDAGIAILQFVPYPEKTYSSPLSLSPGDYILFAYFITILPFQKQITISLTTSCSHFCKSSFNIPQQQLCTPSCGDGVRGETEQCDNGNKIGCSRNCLPDPSYICNGPVGSGSFCMKQSICGDGIVDQGEICDNGNRTGCSSGCKPDAGHMCTQQIGKPSLCSICGNGILEYGEECDNGNQLGCLSCKIQSGFDCRGVSPSVCLRKDPVCGNGVIEIAEMCDDGNRDNGDGCSRFCTTEFGFSCAGEFGQRSSCSKSSTPVSVCGNSIFQPYPSSSGLIEQCDNGNLQGCQDCRVKSGWFCSSSPGQLSSCFKVTAPTCGNRQFDSGEQCDDGNVDNGDGCNFRCQVEFGWACSRFFQCTRSQTPPPPSSLCGNGVVEPGEECDDLGFPVKNGDGCSVKCRIESGWTCAVVEGQSTCKRLT